jgi:hypothetical protein
MPALRWAVLVALALAACEGEAQRPAEEPQARASSSAPAPNTSTGASDTIVITDSAALAGEYRVAGAGDRDIDLPHGITARISEEGVHVVSDCVNLSWSWVFEGARLATERVPVESCARSLLPEEEAIVEAFDGATGVRRTPANGIEFTGENGSVLLFGQ